MRKLFNILTVSLLIVLLTVSMLQAAFVDAPGKRLTALGGAAVADGGDPSGFFYNPASIAWGHALAVETQMGRQFLGLANDQLSRGGLSGYYALGSWGSVGLGIDQFGSDLYRESRVLLAYAYQYQRMSAGIGINILDRKYEQTPYTTVDPFFDENGYGKVTFAIDFGAQYRLNESWDLGFAARRLNRPNQALADNADDPLPREYQAGAAYRMGMFKFLGDLEFRDRELNGSDVTPRIGAEAKLLKDLLLLRLGANRDELTAGFTVQFFDRRYTKSFMRPDKDGKQRKVNDTKHVTMRFGYSFRYPTGGITNTAGHHMVGVDFFFDRASESVDVQVLSQNRPKPSEKIVVQHDTVYVEKPEYIQMVVQDTTEIHALQQRIVDLEKDLSIIENFNDALKHLEQSQIYFFQKRYELALDECYNAVEFVPTLAYAYVRIGSIYFTMKNYPEARRAWEKALELDPEYTQVRDYLKQIPTTGR